MNPFKKAFSNPPFGFMKKPDLGPSLADKVADAMAASSRSSSRRRVLCVDDDEAMQELMQRIQRSCGVDILPAQTAGLAKEMIQQRPFDLVILDVGILNGDGVALYEWILKNFPTLNVVFLTGSDRDKVAERVHKIGGSAVVYEKPTSDTLTFLTQFLTYTTARPA